MPRIYFTQHQGKKVLIEDFTNLKPGPEFDTAIQDAARTIHAQPEKSVLAVLDAGGAHFDNSYLGKMKEFTASNTPYIKAAAVVGVSGLLEIALSAVSTFSKRKFYTFKTRQEAMDWLVQQ